MYIIERTKIIICKPNCVRSIFYTLVIWVSENNFPCFNNIGKRLRVLFMNLKESVANKEWGENPTDLKSSHLKTERSNQSWIKVCLKWEFIKEHRKVRKQENKISTKKVIKKKKKILSNFLGRFLCRGLVFLIAILVEFLFSCFPERFRGRVSYFLVFFYKLPPLIMCMRDMKQDLRDL